jgi:protein-disulfide isomerase
VTGERPDSDGLAERRRRRLWLIGATLAMAAVLVAIAIAVAGSDDDESGSTTGPPEGAAEVAALYRGIPQSGYQLGSPDARVTLAEFADLQCPFCGQYGREVLPTIVERYVRTGKLRLVFRNMDFLGEDSTEAALMAGAAARQNKLYQFVDLVYRNQGAENTGWVDDDYLRRIAQAAGLDVERAMRERGDPELRVAIDGAGRAAEDAGIDSTPAFLVQRAGEPPERLEVEALAPGPFTEALDRVVGSGD